MTPPVPRRPGQAASDPAWLAAAEAADRALIRKRDEEQAFARQHSKPTRILGALLIAGFILDIIGGAFQQSPKLGGPVFLVTGILVFRGSQAALRFVAVLCSWILAIGFTRIVWSLAFRQPIKIDKDWVWIKDPGFWIGYVCPLACFAAFAILAFVVLRLRQLPIWTKPVKIWTCIILALSLIEGSRVVWTDYRNKRIALQAADELDAIRAYVNIHGASFSRLSKLEAEKLIRHPTVHSIILNRGGSFTTIGDRKALADPSVPRAAGSIRDYSEFIKLPGEWAKLEVKFILPDPP